METSWHRADGSLYGQCIIEYDMLKSWSRRLLDLQLNLVLHSEEKIWLRAISLNRSSMYIDI